MRMSDRVKDRILAVKSLAGKYNALQISNKLDVPIQSVREAAHKGGFKIVPCENSRKKVSKIGKSDVNDLPLFHKNCNLLSRGW